LKFCRDLWRRQTRVHGLAYGVVCVTLGSAISVELRLVTDRRTDGLTHDSIASRGKNHYSDDDDD